MALYHKHRPQLWQSIIGQDVIIETIQNQIKMNKPAHAYLLSGPRGVGKTTSARLIAKALNCENRKDATAEPCNECSSCRAITAGSALDVIEIDAASHTGVDTVRETIIENAQFQPTRSKYKIFIIDEVHMLSTSAFNALLKTLEEPPHYAIFILATTELGKLPATIISRCQRFNFKKIPREKMVAVLKAIVTEENIKIDDEVLARIAKKSEGAARDAISLLDQLMAATGNQITLADANVLLPATDLETQLEFIKAIADKNVPAGLAIINRTVESGLSLNQFMGDLIDLLRYLLISQADASLAQAELEVSGTLTDEFNTLAKQFSSAELIKLIDRAMKRSQDVKITAIPQLPLELFLVESTLTEDKNQKLETKNENIAVGRQKIEPVPVTSQKEFKNETEKELEKKETEVIAPEISAPAPESIASETSAAPLTRAAVERVWPGFMQTLEANNPSMVFLLKMAKIKDVAGSGIYLSVGYSFHQEKLNERTGKKMLEDLLGRSLGQVVQLTIDIDASATQAPTAELNDLAAAFGGQVI